MLISAFLLLFIFIGVARKYAKNPNSAPTGFQSAIEPLILMIQEDVAKPMLGKKYLKFLPYLLTLFFFIWINNLLGLIPGGANLTGNTSVTAVLAGVTFFCIMAFSNKHYWGHIFAMPGVPKFVLIILTPVEILGIFIKPFALMIRLFANILAGHMIILTVVGLIFITAEMSRGLGMGTAVFSLVFGVFMFSIELLVAFVQAYIFTTLSALFISEAVAEHHHEEAHH
jgi:F-type H+-transporting ATPase subunit a